MEDPSEIKRRIVRALCRSARALRAEQAAWAEGPVDGEDERGLALCSALEAALLHGLRPHLLRAEQAWLPLWRWWAPGLPAAPLPNPHFWPVLGAVTHSNVMEQLTSLKFVRTDVGRCRAWLRVALNDGLLACYLDSLLCDAAALAEWYEPGALLLDAEQSPALLAALQGLDSVRFQLSYRSAALDQWTPGPLALAGLCPAEEESCGTAHAEPPVALGATDGKDGDAGDRRPPVGSPEAERQTERDRGADSTSAADGVEAERGNRASHSQIDLPVGGGVAWPTAREAAEPSGVAMVPSACDSDSAGPAAATGRAGSGRGESPSAEEEEATSVARQQEAPPKGAAESNGDSNPFAKMLAWIKEVGLAGGSDQGREASSGEPPVTADERAAPDAAVEFPSSAAREVDGREQKVSGKEAKASSSGSPVSVINRALPGGDHNDGTLDGAHSGAELELPSPPLMEPQQGTANPEATRGCGETIGPSDVTDHREREPELSPSVERRAHPSQPLFMEFSDLNEEIDGGDILFSRHLQSYPKKKAKKPKKTALGVLFEDPKGAKEMPCKSKSAADANTVNAGKPGHAKAGPNQSSSDCSRENKNVSFCKEPCPDLKGNLGSDRESRISLPEIQISHITQGDFTKRSGQDENTTADPLSQSPRGTGVVVEGDNSPPRAGNTGDNDAVDSSRSPNLISAAVSNIAKASGCLPTNDSSDDDFYGHYPDGSSEAEPLGGPSGARISRTSATRKSRKVTRRRKELGPTKATARAGEMAVPAAVAALLQDVPNRHQGGRSSCSSIDDDDIVVVAHRKTQGGAEDPFGGVRKMGLLLKRRRMKTWKEYFCELTASELRLYLPDGRAADNPAPPPSPVDPAAPAGEAARPFDGAPGERSGHGAVAVSLNDGYVLHKAYSLRLCQSVALLGLTKLSVYAAPADCLELCFAGQKLFFQAGSADDAEDWVERLREVLHEMGHRAVDE
ncbi:pleckstrin homology domain-containing family M member 1-like [Lethenteron reissneri]|uniref:pleckstrin homology domain-containing family M member 1-like n=1 Tax=Lethenteron reissneri TaxID=7753 RepID=UPI002AB794F9|nr:pleckstrin homology domain-containing family M member 1-like [Lethenteron reissneri]